MAGGFKGLGKKEQAAVAEYVSGEYDRLVFQSPNSYVSLNAQNDPDAWQEKLRELIASDAERVRNILDAAKQGQRWSVKGFTLIELSIVLVVIGLIVGGVLVGQDLVRAAGERAQITQIEKFNSAANTFFSKYGYLPGDIKDPDASSFGFLPRGTNPGQGDGNGILESFNSNGLNSGAPVGEVVMFWVDLSTAHMIEGGFSAATPSSTVINFSNPALYLPAAAIGRSNYVYIWSGRQNIPPAAFSGAFNMFGIVATSGLLSGTVEGSGPIFGLTVKEAYDIDNKIDDGKPQTGRVLAVYSGPNCGWSNFSGASAICGDASQRAASPTATSCFDNGGIAGATNYSVAYNGGSGVNCAISVRMQAGD